MISIIKGKKQAELVLVILFWLAVWQIVSQIIAQDLILVSPAAVVKTLFTLVGESGFWITVKFSFIRIVGGFLSAVTIGILLAMASGFSRLVRILLVPFINVIKTIPVASFIILVLIWSGSRNLSTIISFLMVLPIIYTNVLEGILQTDPKLLEMAKVFRVSLIKRMRAIYIPGIMPYFASGSKIGLGLCWKSGIAAEVIGLPVGSIGERLYQAKIFLSTAELFSWTIVIVMISWLFERAFLGLIGLFEKRLEKGVSK
jgi:NitT/TauT family transport system permease protein